jgi:hypothetical protein
MNGNNKSFYPSDMFEFIHHPEYGCRHLKELKLKDMVMLEINLNLHSNHCSCIHNG